MLATVDVRVITEAQAALEEERQAAERAVQEAQQRAHAQAMLNGAHQAEQEALDAADAALGVMRSNLLAALAAYQEAARIEVGVLQARQQQIQARRLLGEWPSHHPGPTVTGSQKCQVLADTEPLVRELPAWRP